MVRSQKKRPDHMWSGVDFFRDCTQSGPESQDQTVLQSRLDWTAKSYFGPVSKFGIDCFQIGPVRSGQSKSKVQVGGLSWKLKLEVQVGGSSQKPKLEALVRGSS